jgi:DNA-binding transcriptional LysR family regulator
VQDEPPDHAPSDEGHTGWFAYMPDGGRPDDTEEPWVPPPHGSVIRLMGEHTVTVPLWSDQDGLMFNDPTELVREFGVSPDLAADLATWGIAWEAQAGHPAHDAEAARLVRRLSTELEDDYHFVYRP